MKIRTWKLEEYFPELKYLVPHRNISNVGYSIKYHMDFDIVYEQQIMFYGQIDPTVKSVEESNTGKQIFKRV